MNRVKKPKNVPVQIHVTRRAADYHACPVGHPKEWGCGPSPEAAIRDFELSHPAYADRLRVVTYEDRQEQSKAEIEAYCMVATMRAFQFPLRRRWPWLTS